MNVVGKNQGVATLIPIPAILVSASVTSDLESVLNDLHRRQPLSPLICYIGC